MPTYKTCSTVFSRQSQDTGTGRIWIPSSYGGYEPTSNDSCDDVDAANDCTKGYKIIDTEGET